MLSDGTLQDIGPSLISAAGLLALAYLDRSVVLAGLSVALAALAVALVVAGIDRPETILFAVFGAAFLATGLVLRPRART